MERPPGEGPAQRGCRPHVELGGGFQGPPASLVLAGPGQEGEGGEDCQGGAEAGDGDGDGKVKK